MIVSLIRASELKEELITPEVAEAEPDVIKKEKVEEDKEKSFWFKPSATSRKLVVAHLNDSVDIAQLFTSTVITKEVLDKLEPIVANKFRYESH